MSATVPTKAKPSYWKSLSRNLGFIGSCVGGISAVSLICSGFNVGWATPLKKVLEQYFVITSNLRSLIEPYVVPVFQALADMFTIRFFFGPHWADILLLMMVYLGSRVKSYAAAGKHIRMVLMLLLSLAIALTSSFFGSFGNLSGWQDAFWSSVVPLAGFFVYDVIYSLVGATVDRKNTQTWGSEFVRHLTFSVPLLLIAASANFLLAYSFVLHLGNTPYQAFILLFLVDYVLVSAYWALRSFQHACKREERWMGETIAERFRRSSATNVSLNIAIVIASALAFVLTNAGLKAAGVGFSALCQ